MGALQKADSYTVAEVAEIMQVHPETVRRWIWNEELRAWMTRRGTGGGYRVNHAELARFVKARYPHLALDLPDPGERGIGGSDGIV